MNNFLEQIGINIKWLGIFLNSFGLSFFKKRGVTYYEIRQNNWCIQPAIILFLRKLLGFIDLVNLSNHIV
jgi:hypothetical protein